MKQFFFIIIIFFSLSGYGQILEQESEAAFPGGMEAFYDFVKNNIRYPKQAIKNHSSGIVFVEFYIDEKGNVNKDSLRIVSAAEMSEVGGTELAQEITSDKSLEREALRVIGSSPRWIPEKEEGKPVALKMVFPVTFEKNVPAKLNRRKYKTRQAILSLTPSIVTA